MSWQPFGWWDELRSWMMFDTCKKIQVIWAYPNESCDLCWRSSHIQISNLNLNPFNTNDFQQGLKTLLCLEHGMFFFFFALLTSIYNQAAFTEWTTRRPPSETMKEGSRLICVSSLCEFIFFVLFCSNNYFFFYKLGYICMNYDGNDEHTTTNTNTEGLEMQMHLEP